MAGEQELERARSMAEPAWTSLLRELAAIAQTGLAFARDPFDLERYARVGELAAALIAVPTETSPAVIAALLQDEPGYATPKIDVRAGLFRDGRILLVREVTDGLWSLPGGFADVNLSPSQAIEAEIEQETGFTARATKLVSLLDRRRHHGAHPRLRYCYKAFFLAEITGGAARPSLETTAVDFFPEDALPPLSTGRVTAALIARLYAHWRAPGLPTEFD
jgi:ADP-ribose pyrophosphatase YjhB (NUDIX family)